LRVPHEISSPIPDSETGRCPDNETYVDSFARGLLVIRTFSRDQERQTLSEVASSAGISRASARRLLHTLVQLNYAQYDGRYFSLKPKILDLGYAYVSSMEFGDLVVDSMHELAARTDSSCAISILEGHDVVYAARTTVRRVTSRSFPVGCRFPAHILSMGRIQLAALSDEALDAYLATAHFERFTRYTVVDPAELRRIIRADGEKGWSLVKREFDEGLCAMAMAVRNKKGDVIAGLGFALAPDRADDPAFIDESLIELAKTIGTINGLMRLRA
jgi:IclR family transcriptional regulator, pca regulon regulatory protein